VGGLDPKPVGLRNLAGVEVTLCTDAEEGDRVAGLGGDSTAEVLADSEEGGPDGVLLGDTLGFALLVERVVSFLVVDCGISEAARLYLTKCL